MGNDQPLRGALLGCGHASLFHLRAWAQIKGVRIVALANRTVSKAHARAVEFDIPIAHTYADYTKLLDTERLDFVDIATPPELHRELVEAAARRGLNVLCQKPMAESMDEARAMIAACEAAGVRFSVNENWRWRSWYRDIKGLLNEGVIGRIRYARIAHHGNGALPLPDGSPPPLFVNQAYTARMDRLIVYEWGVHLIDVSRFLLGEVRSIYARMDHTSTLCQGEDRALLVLDLDGITGLVDISWWTTCRDSDRSLLEEVTIEGDEGSIELIPASGDLLRVTTKEGSWERPALSVSPPEAYQASYTSAQRHFIEGLRSGEEHETSGRDNLLTLAATFAAYESAAEGTVVSL